LMRQPTKAQSTNEITLQRVKSEYDYAATTIANFLTSVPDDPEWLVRKADYLDGIGDLSKNAHKSEKAQTSYREALRLREQLIHLRPELTADLQLANARTLNKLGNSHYVKAAQSAMDAYNRALAVLKEIHFGDHTSNTRALEAQELTGVIWRN